MKSAMARNLTAPETRGGSRQPRSVSRPRRGRARRWPRPARGRAFEAIATRSARPSRRSAAWAAGAGACRARCDSSTRSTAGQSRSATATAASARPAVDGVRSRISFRSAKLDRDRRGIAARARARHCVKRRREHRRRGDVAGRAQIDGWRTARRSPLRHQAWPPPLRRVSAVARIQAG